MKRKDIYSIILFLLFSASVAQGSSYEFNERVQQAYLQIVRLKFEEGKRLLDEEQRLNPSNSLPLLYYSYIDFLKAFISEEKKDFETFRTNMDERQQEFKGEGSPFFLYANAELMLQHAMLRIKFREFVPAAWEIRKAYKIIQKNTIAYPAFPLNKKITGFLHVLIGAVPKDYRWLIDLAGMKGTIPQGTDELNSLLKESATTSFYVYKEEILFYLANISLSFAQGENSSATLMEIIKPLCPQNLLMRYCYSSMMMKSGRNIEALQTLTDTASAEGSYPFYFLSYKTGLSKLRKLDFTAETDFRYFISHFKGVNFVRSAYQKLAWIYLLKGEREKYSETIAVCKMHGSDFVDEDKDATKEAKDDEVPNLILLRARLLFDGGYYQQALAEIAGKPIENFSRFKDQLEVTYRLARIFHKLNQTDKAIGYFGQTLKNGTSSFWYFAANSALLLGNIYEEKNDFEKAENYYKKCLSIRNHEYQNSIDQKAEAGLERIDVKK